MKNGFKYILLILSSLLLMQGAWAEQGVGKYLSTAYLNAATPSHTQNMDMGSHAAMHAHQSTSCADACEKMLDHAKQADLACDAGGACDMVFCVAGGFGLMPTLGVFVALQSHGAEMWVFDDAYRSQHYSPPVPPPLV